MSNEADDDDELLRAAIMASLDHQTVSSPADFDAAIAASLSEAHTQAFEASVGLDDEEGQLCRAIEASRVADIGGDGYLHYRPHVHQPGGESRSADNRDHRLPVVQPRHLPAPPPSLEACLLSDDEMEARRLQAIFDHEQQHLDAHAEMGATSFHADVEEAAARLAAATAAAADEAEAAAARIAAEEQARRDALAAAELQAAFEREDHERRQALEEQERHRALAMRAAHEAEAQIERRHRNDAVLDAQRQAERAIAERVAAETRAATCRASAEETRQSGNCDDAVRGAAPGFAPASRGASSTAGAPTAFQWSAVVPEAPGCNCRRPTTIPVAHGAAGSWSSNSEGTSAPATEPAGLAADADFARSLHLQEVQGLRSLPPPFRSAAPPITAPKLARSSRVISLIIDGMNVGRSHGFVDQEFEDTTCSKRLEFDRIRQDHNENMKPVLCCAVTAVIDACLRINHSEEAKAAGVEYRPMAFLPEWVRDGGRNGARVGFNADRLEAYRDYVTYTPSRRNDDHPQIRYAMAEGMAGHEAYILTNDNFRDHQEQGVITPEWFQHNVVAYSWVGRQNRLLVTPPVHCDLPFL